MSSINEFLIFISEFLGCQAPTSNTQAQKTVNKNEQILWGKMHTHNNNVFIWSYSDKYAQHPHPTAD